LLVCSRMFKACERLGWKIIPGENRFWGVTLVQGKDKLILELRERLAQVKKLLTAEQRASPFYRPGQEWTQIKVPTGELRIRVKSARYSLVKEWRETAESPLQEKLVEIISQI